MADPLEPMMHSVLTGSRRWWVEHGNSLYAPRCLPDSCIDSIVTDPPAGIAFMNADWDKNRGGRDQWIAWLTEIVREAYRVLKPGGHALFWALPKTAHWTATAVEDAGFQIRDKIVHLFGQGMPKSQDASKAIDARNGQSANRVVTSTYTASGNAGTSTADKGGTYAVGVANSGPVELKRTVGATEDSRKWDGWGTALRPATEDWILARKPLNGTLAENLTAHGVGALNIDANRIPRNYAEEPDRPESWRNSGHSAKPDAEKIAAPPGIGINLHPLGGWPANAVFSHVLDCAIGDCVVDCPIAALAQQSGVKQSGMMKAGTPRPRKGPVLGELAGAPSTRDTFADRGTAARFFNVFDSDQLDTAHGFYYVAKPATAERELGCDHLPLKSAAGETIAGDSSGRRNNHPTLKGFALMRFLCRLVTPPNGVCLDLFCGSGTTGCAAMMEGFRFIGIELNNSADKPFVDISRARIAHVIGGSLPEPATAPKKRKVKQQDLFGGDHG